MEKRNDPDSDKTTIYSDNIHKALPGKPADLKEMLEMLQTLSYLLETMQLKDLEKVSLKYGIESLVRVAEAGGPCEYLQLIQNEILKRLGS